MHLNSCEIFRRFALSYFRTEAFRDVIEISPGANPSVYCNLVNDTKLRWETLGLGSDARFSIKNSAPYAFPVPSESFDVLISGQVIEHVPIVWEWFRECTRVVRPGGIIITVSPVSWPHHPDPFDCWRIYPDGMRALCDYSGVEVELCEWGNYSAPAFQRVVGGRAWEMLG